MPISAFYLWFQDHILPTKLTLGLEIALWAPAVLPFTVLQQMAFTGSSTVLGFMDKVTSGNDV